MTSQRSNESERDERFETVRTFVREWAMLDVADCVTDQLEALEALASIQAELQGYREALEEIADIEGDLNAMGSPSANILAGIAAAALSGEGERP